MQNIKKIITNYKKTFIVLTITLILLIFISIYCLTNKKENKVIDSKQITWNQNPSNEKDYNTALEQWKNQCYFKSGNTYTGVEIRDKIGRSDLTLYCLDGGSIKPLTNISIGCMQASPNFNYQIKYCYFPGWIYDNIVLMNPNQSRTETHNSPDKIYFGLYGPGTYFNTYCDTKPPPTKPSK